METWEIVTMSRKEARRPGLVQLAVAGKITTAEGARSLTMTPRQFRRLETPYRAEGVQGLVHRLRGRPSPRALDVEVRDRVRCQHRAGAGRRRPQRQGRGVRLRRGDAVYVATQGAAPA